MPNRKSFRILLRSSWQVVNIGDIAHTPGVLALIEEKFPEAEVVLWASDDLTEEIANMEHKRFPKLRIVKGHLEQDGKASNKELAEAILWCDFLLHGSGPYLVAHKDIEAFIKLTSKPFGVFGITFDGNLEHVKILSAAEFIFFRDSISLKKALEIGVKSKVMEFGPDGAFSVDLRNDEKAETFLRSKGLEEKKFLCCIPRLRYTPYWKITNRPLIEERHMRNEAMKEHDHLPLRKAIIEIVRQMGFKVLICPEDKTQMEVGKEMLLDKLPPDVIPNVVWRENYWITDEALSVYVRSAGLFGNEMHSPIMCIGNGIPAIVCRWEEQSSKGFMWRDIGLGDWLFDMDVESDVNRLVQTVIEIVRDPIRAKEKVEKAQEIVKLRQNRMIDILKRVISKTNSQ